MWTDEEANAKMFSDADLIASLKANLTAERAQREELEQEVERLADMAAFYAKGMDEQHAEVVRLRAELANKHGGDGSVLHVTRESQDALYAERDDLKAEVERLQRDLGRALDDLLRVGAEVERLRETNEELREMLASEDAELYRENERLRAKVGRIESLIQAAAGVVHVDDIRNALAKEQ